LEHSVVALICLCTTGLLNKTTLDCAAMPHLVSSKTLKAKAKEKNMTQGAVVGPVVVVLATAASAAARGHGARLLDPCVGAQRFWNKLAMKSNLVSFLLLSQVTKNNFLPTRSRCNC
jgi:hypothetical protein